jgi:hypothetical protein
MRRSTAIGLLITALAAPVDARQAPPVAAAAPAVACTPASLYAHGLDEHGADFARVAELAGLAPLRSWLIQRPAEIRAGTDCAALARSPWGPRLTLAAEPALLAPLPVAGAIVYNSTYPRSRNDGALWAGRGLNAGASAGVHVEYGRLSATFAPTVWYQENARFPIMRHDLDQLSEFAYTGHLGVIDWPQRHGSRSFTTLDPGQSQISVRLAGFNAGFSTENQWWGPARRNPLLMSSTAPGIPRVFVGTYRPVDVRIGAFETNFFWGHVRESAFFDDDPTNDRSLLAGVVFAFHPRPLPGFSIGIARAYLNHIPAGGLPLSEYLTRPYTGIRENPQVGELQDNNLLSIFGRWALPEAGFEVYAEWGREDGWADLTDVINEPDHSQAFTLGLQKVFAGSAARWVRVAGELTNLQAAYPYRGGRYVQTWYMHAGLRQGYTHRGQLIGAPIGPGSTAQFIGVDLFDRSGVTGAFVERTRYDDDAYYNLWGRLYGMHGHDVELTAGARKVYFWEDFDVVGALSYSWRRNRNFIGHETGSWNFRTEGNISARLGLHWRPGGVRR